MMKSMREINIDANTVGWYQSISIDSLYDSALVEAHYAYQKSIENSIVIIYDSNLTEYTGKLNIKAFRLTDEFMKIYQPNSMNATGVTIQYRYIYINLYLYYM